MPEIINVRSFDFDGCLFNKKYRAQYNPEGINNSPNYLYKSDDTNNSLIKANETFIATNAEEINKGNFSKVILMIGSRRQSFYADMVNTLSRMRITCITESCFSALQKLSSEFQTRTKVLCEVDKYLLADSFGLTPAGENFDAIIQYRQGENKSSKIEDNFSAFFDDKSKLNLVYAQIHRVASLNPDAEIIYNFYDDELNRVLNPLKLFFTENPDLIPANLSLKLHSYSGETIEAIANIKGTGKIDYNYEYNLKKMWVDVDTNFYPATIFTTSFKTKNTKESCELVNALVGKKLENFKQTRATETPTLATSAAASVASAATGPATSFFAHKQATAARPPQINPSSYLSKLAGFF